MLSLDSDEDTVVYASSFSKTICPGIRVGYIIGPSELIARIARRATNTYISPSMLSAAVVYEFCASGAIDRSVAHVREALAERCQRLADGLVEALPESSVVAPDGGYFLWVELPEGLDPTKLTAAAAEHGVAVVERRRLRGRWPLGRAAPVLRAGHACGDRRGSGAARGRRRFARLATVALACQHELLG